MDNLIFGKTVEERMGDFQRGVAVESIGYGLVVILIHQLISKLLGADSILVSLVILFIYIVTLHKSVVDKDIHEDYGSFSYRGVYFPIDLGEDKSITTRKLEVKIRNRMVSVAVNMYLIGDFAFRILNELQVGRFDELIRVLLVILIVSIPATSLYMYSFVKMCEEYQVALTAPIIGVIYGEVLLDDELKSEMYPRYIDWLTSSKRKRRRDYQEEENKYYEQVDKEIQKRMEEVRVVKTGLVVINSISEDNVEEVEERIREIFWKDGYDVHVDLEELIKYKEHEHNKNEGSKGQPEEVEEYDLSELVGNDSEEQEEQEEQEELKGNTEGQEDVE